MLRQDHVLENTLLRKTFGPRMEKEHRDKGKCIAKNCMM
jgi:hypothetical protein